MINKHRDTYNLVEKKHKLQERILCFSKSQNDDTI